MIDFITKIRGGYRVREATKQGYTDAFEGDSINLEQPNSKTRRGRVGKQCSQTLTTSCNIGVVIDDTQGFDGVRYYENISPCLRANRHGLKVITGCEKEGQNMRIRKLTPKECWRLQGFSDEDFEKAAKVNSNSQLYKQAGNSICVPVIEAIYSKLLEFYG